MTLLEITEVDDADETVSAVSWSAIVSGGLAAVAATLVLLLLGSGLGLSLVSPWSSSGITPATFAVSTAIWLIVVQWLASALGGYLTGRLRTRWDGVHKDEVFFRDTAHGLLAWALATVFVAGVLSTATSAIISGGSRELSVLASGPGQGAGQAANHNSQSGPWSPTDYYVDLMFRPPADSSSVSIPPAASQMATESRHEASRILLAGFAAGSVSPTDKSYLVQLVSASTGRPVADAQKRVDEVLTQIEQITNKARQAADTARKVWITTSLLTALSLIIGAFIASVAAAIGGRLRDEV